MKEKFTDILIPVDATLRDAMVSLDKSALGVVFILDEKNVLQGVLTDGDVRRALLAGSGIDAPVAGHMNCSFVSGSSQADNKQNLQLLNEKIRCLPVLDPDGRVVDMLHWKDLYRLPVMEPVLKGKEFEYVADCLVTNWISSQGKYVERFQETFQSYLPTAHALCVCNGTVALHLAMTALGIGPGDEVLIPDLTFVSPASMALLCGAKPVFVDVDRSTWTIDSAAIEDRITDKTKAIVPVHLYGHPCDMDPIMEIACRHSLFVIEDCAEALGAEYKGRKVGTIGDIGTFSFFANKVITTGEGGMVTTNNPDLHRRMQLLRDHGMSREKRYWHDIAGFNYRLTNLQAAIGLGQMERIESFLTYREEVVERYNSNLGGIEGIILPPKKEWAKNIFWLYSIVVDEEKSGIDRDGLISRLSGYGIDTRPFFPPLHLQPPFVPERDKGFPVTEWLANRGMSLPTSNNITFEDVDRVCAAIESIVGHTSFLGRYKQ